MRPVWVGWGPKAPPKPPQEHLRGQGQGLLLPTPKNGKTPPPPRLLRQGRGPPRRTSKSGPKKNALPMRQSKGGLPVMLVSDKMKMEALAALEAADCTGVVEKEEEEAVEPDCTTDFTAQVEEAMEVDCTGFHGEDDYYDHTGYTNVQAPWPPELTLHGLLAPKLEVSTIAAKLQAKSSYLIQAELGDRWMRQDLAQMCFFLWNLYTRPGASARPDALTFKGLLQPEPEVHEIAASLEATSARLLQAEIEARWMMHDLVQQCFFSWKRYYRAVVLKMEEMEKQHGFDAGSRQLLDYLTFEELQSSSALCWKFAYAPAS